MMRAEWIDVDAGTLGVDVSEHGTRGYPKPRVPARNETALESRGRSTHAATPQLGARQSLGHVPPAVPE